MKSKAIVTDVIFRLEDTGRIKKLRNGSYTVEASLETYTGVVDSVNAHFAYVVLDGEDEQEDIWVAKQDLLGALDDDKVKVVLKPRRHGKKPEGKVVEIVEHSREEFVGRLEMSARYGFVIPDFKKMFHDIYVHYNDLNGAKHGEKVIVKIIQWPEKDKKT